MNIYLGKEMYVRSCNKCFFTLRTAYIQFIKKKTIFFSLATLVKHLYRCTLTILNNKSDFRNSNNSGCLSSLNLHPILTLKIKINIKDSLLYIDCDL